MIDYAVVASYLIACGVGVARARMKSYGKGVAHSLLLPSYDALATSWRPVGRKASLGMPRGVPAFAVLRLFVFSMIDEAEPFLCISAAFRWH